MNIVAKPKACVLYLKRETFWPLFQLQMVLSDSSTNVLTVKCHSELKISLHEMATTTNEFSFDTNSDDEDAATEDAVHPSSTCCMRRVISLQQDFINEKPLLQIIIEEAGHKCYFLPKFHCELNPIEMYWGWVKIRE